MRENAEASLGAFVQHTMVKPKSAMLGEQEQLPKDFALNVLKDLQLLKAACRAG